MQSINDRIYDSSRGSAILPTGGREEETPTRRAFLLAMLHYCPAAAAGKLRGGWEGGEEPRCNTSTAMGTVLNNLRQVKSERFCASFSHLVLQSARLLRSFGMDGRYRTRT